MRVQGFYITENRVFTSDGQVCEQYPLEFLLNATGELKAFYDLNHDVACLLAWIGLTSKELHKLNETEKCYIDGGYKLVLFSKRFFAVDKGWHETSFVDSSRYHNSASIYPPVSDPEACFACAREAASVLSEVESTLAGIGLRVNGSLSSPVAVFMENWCK
jgi:hypothetical protein